MARMEVEPNRRILVVDDNHEIHADIRRLLMPAEESAELEELGNQLFDEPEEKQPKIRFEVDFALQGNIALGLVEDSIAAARPYGVAFVDMRMPPGWDGLETVQRI